VSGSSPRVSVVVPNYNYARFLPQRMESILEQTYTDLEVILLDDASMDDSREVVERYAGDRRVRIRINKQNSGSPFAQWNRGVSMARGEFVWIAEADDFVETKFLEHLVPLLEKDPRLGLAYCQSRVVDETGMEIEAFPPYLERLWPGRWRQSFRNNGRDEVARYLLNRCTIPNASAVLFRRRAFQEAGGADESMKLCGDWLTYVRILEKWDLAYSPLPLNAFRCHDAMVRSVMSGNPREIEERYLVLEAALSKSKVSKRDRRRALESRMYLWVDLAEKHGWEFGHYAMAGIRCAAARVDPAYVLRFARKRKTYRLRRLLAKGRKS